MYNLIAVIMRRTANRGLLAVPMLGGVGQTPTLFVWTTVWKCGKMGNANSYYYGQ